MRNLIIDEALSWVGVKFKHLGRDRSGLDCLGLFVVIARALALKTKYGSFISDYDRLDYSKTPDENFLEKILDNLFEPANSIMAGDLLLLSGAHLAIANFHHNHYNSMIHAYAKARMVVHHRISEEWYARIKKIYKIIKY